MIRRSKEWLRTRRLEKRLRRLPFEMLESMARSGLISKAEFRRACGVRD